MIDTSSSLVPKVVPAVYPVTNVTSAFSRLLEARQEYRRIAEQEKTKRHAIDAWEKVRLQELKNQQVILQQYLDATFSERRHVIDGFFNALDQGLESGNLELIDKAISGIVDIVKESPLRQVDNLIAALNDNSVKTIEF